LTPCWATHDAVAEGKACPDVRRTTHKISSRRALVAMCADQHDTLEDEVRVVAHGSSRGCSP
jgi:hypothetical protein